MTKQELSYTSSITGMPDASGINDKIGKYVAEIADLKNLLTLNLHKCFYELNMMNSIQEGKIINFWLIGGGLVDNVNNKYSFY